MGKVLCSVATYKRYDTTLPLVLQAVANQTRIPDKVLICDDNDEPQDLRQNFVYQSIFRLFDQKGIDWQVIFAPKKGQQHIHQIANTFGYEYVWRVDDDCIPESNVLENLYSEIGNYGAVGGSILTPGQVQKTEKSTGLIENIDSEHNIQWGYIRRFKEVQHLHCSFLYRAGLHDYALG